MKSEYDLKDLFIFYGEVAEDGETSPSIVLKTAEQRFVGERLKGSKNKMFKEKIKYVDVIYPNIAFEKIKENPLSEYINQEGIDFLVENGKLTKSRLRIVSLILNASLDDKNMLLEGLKAYNRGKNIVFT